MWFFFDKKLDFFFYLPRCTKNETKKKGSREVRERTIKMRSWNRRKLQKSYSKFVLKILETTLGFMESVSLIFRLSDFHRCWLWKFVDGDRFVRFRLCLCFCHRRWWIVFGLWCCGGSIDFARWLIIDEWIEFCGDERLVFVVGDEVIISSSSFSNLPS